MLPLQGFPGPPKALKMSLLVFRKQSRVFDSESLFEPSKAMDGYVSPSPPEGVCAGGPQSRSATVSAHMELMDMGDHLYC